MKRYTDIHHHILYGMDDGAQNPKEMHAMLKKAYEDGIGRIVATPHVTPGVRRFNREQYRQSLEEARAYCKTCGLDIELYEGAEILYTGQTCEFLAAGRVPTMAGTDHVLVEFSPDVRFDRFCEALDALQGHGFLPIIAHVERYQCLSSHPSRAEKIKEEMEVCFQVNCSSIIGKKDAATRRFVEKLLDWDMIDAIATDAHSSGARCVHMKEAWRLLKKEFGASYANELTDGHLLFDVPAE